LPSAPTGAKIRPVAGYTDDQIRRFQARVAPYRRPAPAADPARSALLVIDVQCYFADLAAPALPALRRTVDACRALAVPVLFTRHGHPADGGDDGMLGAWWGELIRIDTPDHALLPESGYRDGDPVVDKRRYDAFFATDLADRLRALHVRDLALAGVMTNLCVETTARSAFVRDLRVHVLLDATATAREELHLASLLNLAFGFAHVQTAAEWIEELRAATA
jgi:nicotinamidase-related amidase